MMNTKNFGQNDYEEGDVIVYKTATVERVVKVDEKLGEMNYEEYDDRTGFSATVIEEYGREYGKKHEGEEGNEVWGYDNQITEIRG